MNDFTKEEYLFIANGIMHSIDSWGMTLRSSNPSIRTLSWVLNDNVFPPHTSHKLLREDVIKIRDYLNEYLSRTVNKDE